MDAKEINGALVDVLDIVTKHEHEGKDDGRYGQPKLIHLHLKNCSIYGRNRVKSLYTETLS